MALTLELAPVPDQEAAAPQPPAAVAKRGSCPCCGRFVARGGHCSLTVPVYRDGTYLGREHY